MQKIDIVSTLFPVFQSTLPITHSERMNNPRTNPTWQASQPDFQDPSLLQKSRITLTHSREFEMCCAEEEIRGKNLDHVKKYTCYHVKNGPNGAQSGAQYLENWAHGTNFDPDPAVFTLNWLIYKKDEHLSQKLVYSQERCR